MNDPDFLGSGGDFDAVKDEFTEKIRKRNEASTRPLQDIRDAVSDKAVEYASKAKDTVLGEKASDFARLATSWMSDAMAEGGDAAPSVSDDALPAAKAASGDLAGKAGEVVPLLSREGYRGKGFRNRKD